MSFVDCMPHRSTTPGAGPINNDGDRRIDSYLIQRAFYTRYGKMHGNKTQGLLLPNGMIGHAWVHSVAQNDAGMINLSGLEEYLRDILEPYRVGEAQLLPAVYGDAIYQPSEVILVRNADSLYFRRLNSAREKIEHEFGLYAILWKKLRQTDSIKLYDNGSYVVKRIIVYWFITNCYTCLNENTVTARFGIPPSSLSEYLAQEVEPYNGDINNILDDILQD